MPHLGRDTAWHTFIPFTRDYATFLTTTFGRFIHLLVRCRRPKRPDAYLRNRIPLTRRFGPLDERLWPTGTASRTATHQTDCNGDGTGGS